MEDLKEGSFRERRSSTRFVAAVEDLPDLMYLDLKHEWWINGKVTVPPAGPVGVVTVLRKQISLFFLKIAKLNE